MRRGARAEAITVDSPPMKALLLWVALCGIAFAQTPPQEGREYVQLRSTVAAKSGDRIEVVEFFYYGCAVCYETQPHLSRWLAASATKVALVRIPAVFTESSDFARTFYAPAA
jgi:thiol:disulfide interchange protein DsbA